MRRLASSRTVSTSTDSSPSVWTSPPNPRPRKMPPRVVTRLAAARRAASARVSHFLTTPTWRRVKWTADRALLFAVVGAVGWAAVNGIFVAHRAAHDRAQADIHLGSWPAVHFSPLSGGKAPTNTAPPAVVLNGARSNRISITITNDGADGITLTGGTLTGPYLAGPTKLVPYKNRGFIAGSDTGLLVGTATVDCDAAAPVAHALVDGQPGSARPTTEVTVSAKDTNGTVHTVRLVLDTTALAVQGRMCTR